MQIAFLITDLDYGGAERQLISVSTGLKERGWNIGVISMLPPQAFTENLEQSGISVETLNMRRGVPDPRAAFTLARLLREWRPEILLTFMFHANLLGRIIGRWVGIPVIISSVRTENFGGIWRKWIMRLTDWMGDITTTNSNLVAGNLIKQEVVPKGRIRVIPNGLVLDKYTDSGFDPYAIRHDLAVPQEAFLWLAVGRLEEAKDYPNLLNAFKMAREAGSDSYLCIAGQGSLLTFLEQETIDLGIDDKVRFLGLRRDIPALLQAADGFVLSSAWEGLPNALIEAMAAGKPVVATRVGGVPEVVKDGVSGYLVPPRDTKALAEAMTRIMCHTERQRESMGRAGRAWIEANYTLEHVVDSWEALFYELLATKGRF